MKPLTTKGLLLGVVLLLLAILSTVVVFNAGNRNIPEPAAPHRTP